MKKTIIFLQAFVIAVLLAALLGGPLARMHAGTEPAHDALYQAIQSLDTQLFDASNRCDLEKFGPMLADDLEFYHDKTGLARTGKALVEGVKNNLCGKVTRELVPGTLEVYPIATYGAVEIGVHRFHHPGHEETEGVGEAKFIHLWEQKDGAWKLTRVISFDHHGAGK
jgi:ketosteroid isomerase-like protein